MRYVMLVAAAVVVVMMAVVAKQKPHQAYEKNEQEMETFFSLSRNLSLNSTYIDHFKLY